jgi:hypothetical protein
MTPVAASPPLSCGQSTARCSRSAEAADQHSSFRVEKFFDQVLLATENGTLLGIVTRRRRRPWRRRSSYPSNDERRPRRGSRRRVVAVAARADAGATSVTSLPRRRPAPRRGQSTSYRLRETIAGAKYQVFVLPFPTLRYRVCPKRCGEQDKKRPSLQRGNARSMPWASSVRVEPADHLRAVDGTFAIRCCRSSRFLDGRCCA